MTIRTIRGVVTGHNFIETGRLSLTHNDPDEQLQSSQTGSS
jgi:hypothetical protein